MKCTQVRITLPPEAAARAGQARLQNPDDGDIVTEEQAKLYRGSEFNQGRGCGDLHLVYRDGMACVNFINDDGVRVNYDYPIHSVVRISHVAG